MKILGKKEWPMLTERMKHGKKTDLLQKSHMPEFFVLVQENVIFFALKCTAETKVWNDFNVI